MRGINRLMAVLSEAESEDVFRGKTYFLEG
jgi:hypothetical protein